MNFKAAALAAACVVVASCHTQPTIDYRSVFSDYDGNRLNQARVKDMTGICASVPEGAQSKDAFCIALHQATACADDENQCPIKQLHRPKGGY